MTVYALDVTRLWPMAALVAAHGATDFATPTWPLAYAACCMIPSVCVTPVFVCGSLVHFAEDVGWSGSVVLHVLAGLAWWRGGTQRGLELMLAYLSAVHTPAHYLRCWRRGRRVALAAAGAATAVTWQLLLRCFSSTAMVPIDHSVQRVVVAHILTEWGVKCSSRNDELELLVSSSIHRHVGKL
mgnify:CR=1 FL=1